MRRAFGAVAQLGERFHGMEEVVGLHDWPFRFLPRHQRCTVL